MNENLLVLNDCKQILFRWYSFYSTRVHSFEQQMERFSCKLNFPRKNDKMHSKEKLNLKEKIQIFIQTSIYVSYSCVLRISDFSFACAMLLLVNKD